MLRGSKKVYSLHFAMHACKMSFVIYVNVGFDTLHQKLLVSSHLERTPNVAPLPQAFSSRFFILPTNGFPQFLGLEKSLEFRGKILEFRKKKYEKIECFYLIFLKIAGFFSLAYEFA